jgi:hypothetical protein
VDLAAENLFLRKQLALYLERQMRPRRADDATRITLVTLSRLLDWRQLLVVVKPKTLIRWHRKGFRLFLALEVEDARTAQNPCGSAPVDRSDGGSECDLGRGADCCGAPREARHPAIAANGEALHASEDDATHAARLASLEHVRSEIMRGPFWRVTFWRVTSSSLSMPRSGSCTSSWRWRWARDESCTGT